MIAVVGAGLAGVAAARALAARGVAVTLYDKSPRLGGRLATRRVSLADGRRAQFDHGCQYLVATTPEFAELLSELRAAGVVEPWIDFPRGLTPQAPRGEAFVAPGGMRAVVEHLATGLAVATGKRVTRLERSERKWMLLLNERETDTATRLILTPPVPQSLELLFKSAVALPRELLFRLREVDYARSLAVLSPSRESPRPDDPHAVDWVGDNQGKGTSPTPAWTVLLSAAASESGWDEPSEALIRAALGGVPTAAQVHKWRYGRALTAYPERCVAVESLNLVLAGDGFGTPVGTAEAAYLSGLASAAAIS